ncbi:MAG: recombinase RecT [Hyphomicrobiales bacterium]|nr:recombinase RecT [Hyphomicrobiales bacterium]
MVGASGSALPIYQHQQPQRLNDHHPHQLDRENGPHQSLTDHHLLRSGQENDPIPHSQKAITSSPRRVRSIPTSRGPKPLLPRSLKEALQLASLLSKSKLVPKGFENPEACLVGILYGMEVGLSPIAALQRMAIIEGRPTIWGDAALALVQASGLLVSISEDVIESEIHKNSTPHFSAICTVKREGRSDPVTRSFSIEDAKRAGLWQKPGPWTDYPKRMLTMRARAFALRDAFPDVLAGLYLREEFEGVEAETRYAKPELGSGSDSIDSQTELDGEEKSYLRSNNQQDILEPATFRRSSRSDSKSLIRRAPPPPREVDLQVPSKTEKQPSTSSQYLDKKEDLPVLSESAEATDYQNASDTLELFDSALACARDTETLEEIREEFDRRIDRLDSGRLQEAGRIFIRHEKRIRATEEAYKTSCDPSAVPVAREPSIMCPEKYESEDEADDQLENSQSNLLMNATGRIGKETLSPHRRRRFSIRPRKGLSLAELNARRKLDLVKYMPCSSTNEEDCDE